MSYKPFKQNRGSYYYDRDNKKESKYDIQRLKLFGFRSGIAWKMIPALFYYAFMILIIGSSILGEIREFKFENIDVFLCVLKYIFIFVIAFSPAIFLSDFEYTKKLPLFKKKTVIGNTLGMLIVIVFSLFMIWTYEYCMSDTYKASSDAYYEEMESKNNERLKQYEESTSDVTTESVTTENTTTD